VLEEAGLPKGVLQVLPGGDEAGAAIVDDPNISMIAFTGSTSVGRQIAATAAAPEARSHSNLGKNPCWCCPTPIWSCSTALAPFGTFLHQPSRPAVGIHLVHKALIDRYAARVAELAKAIKVGEPVPEQVGLRPRHHEKQRNQFTLSLRSYSSGGRAC